jgi:hypothetical protein
MSRLKRQALRNEVTTLLSGLGDSAEDVVATLAGEGVRGLPRDRNNCAIARYLNAVLGADPHLRGVVVGSSKLWVRRAPWWSAATLVEIPVPVQQFISLFDSDAYPQLLAAPVTRNRPAPANV